MSVRTETGAQACGDTLIIEGVLTREARRGPVSQPPGLLRRSMGWSSLELINSIQSSPNSDIGQDLRFDAPRLSSSALAGRPWRPLNSSVSCLAAMVVPFFFMIDWSSCPVVERDPQRVSGAWVFRGTRVPVSALFENLEDGALVSECVDWFPGVSLEQVRAVLDHAARGALATA